MNKILMILVVTVFCTGFTGCVTKNIPVNNGSGIIGKATILPVYKRYPENFEVNFPVRVFTRAYKPAKKRLQRQARLDQITALEELGMPEVERRPFKSRSGERIEEWVYLEKDKVLQFSAGHIVFEGPVTDLERLLMQNGYPDDMIVSESQPNNVLMMISYDYPFTYEERIFVLNNGKLLAKKEGRI